MRSLIHAWVLCLGYCAACLSPASGAEIRGELRMTSGGKALRAEVAKDAVVYFRPKQRPPLEVPDDAYVLATEGKDFVPRVLPVIVGATVRFPNFDPILHNAFSTSQSNSFDVGLYGQGEESEPVRFVNPGLVRVYCNVHHGMVAHILVLDTPYFVIPDEKGRFRLTQLPEGPGELLIWHERATLWRKSIDLQGEELLQVEMEASRRRVPTHLNKAGKPYRRSRNNDY